MDPSTCNLVVEKTDFTSLNVKLCSLAAFQKFIPTSIMSASAQQIYTVSRNVNVFSRSLVEIN